MGIQATNAATTFPPGPYHVRPASETSGWGVCVSNGREIVARIPGRDRGQVRAIARLLAAAPELLEVARSTADQLSRALAICPCTASATAVTACIHCQLMADLRPIVALIDAVEGP